MTIIVLLVIKMEDALNVQLNISQINSQEDVLFAAKNMKDVNIVTAKMNVPFV